MKWKISFYIFLVINILLAYSYLPSLIIPLFIFLILYALLSLFEKATEKKYPNFKISVISILFTLILVEVAMLAFGVKSTYSEKNQGEYSSNWMNYNKDWCHLWTANSEIRIERTEFCFPKKSNSLGLIGTDFLLEKDINEFRVIVLGDSFTEGVGAPSGKAYPSILDSILNELSEKKISIINAGVSGSDIIYGIPLLRDKLMIYKPDLVIYTLNSSDIYTDIPIRGGIKRFLPDSTVRFNQAPWYERIYATSRLFRIVYLNESLIGVNNQKSKNKIVEKSCQEIIESIDEYHKVLNPLDIPFVIIKHPMSYENCQVNNYEDSILGKELFEDTRCIYFNLKSTFIKHQLITCDNNKDYYWPIDQHHNAAGYKKMAEAIAIELEKRNLIPQSDEQK